MNKIKTARGTPRSNLLAALERGETDLAACTSRLRQAAQGVAVIKTDPVEEPALSNLAVLVREVQIAAGKLEALQMLLAEIEPDQAGPLHSVADEDRMDVWLSAAI